MPSAFDVAALIRNELGTSVPRMKLQKLLYYSQAWSVVWDGAPLFRERIEAWINGPVVREVWVDAAHDHGRVGDPLALTHEQRRTVLEVLRVYGRFDGDALSQLTHREQPWLEARRGLLPSDNSRKEITAEDLSAFYGRMATAPRAIPSDLERGFHLLASLPDDEAEHLLEVSYESADDLLRELA